MQGQGVQCKGRVCGVRSAERSEDSPATHLNHVVHPLVLELLLPNAQHARLEGALPGHELKGSISIQYPFRWRVEGVVVEKGQLITFSIRNAPSTSFMSATRSSRARIRLSCAETTILPAKWFIGRNASVAARPTKHDGPRRS